MWDTSRRHAGATVAPALPSVPDLLQAIRGGIDDSLVSPSAFEKLIATAASLPPTHSGASLECHLGLATERVDLVVRLFARDRAAFLEPSSDPADLQLESVRRFVSAWAQKDKQLSQVPYADLELDLEGSSRGCIVGAMIEPSFHEGVAAVLRRQSQSRGTVSSFAVAAQALEATDSEPADAKVLDGVRRCFEALGRDAFIAHVGSLRSRVEGRGDLVRLIASTPRGDLAAYLDGLSWPGDVAELGRCAARLLGSSNRIDIDLSVTTNGLSAETGFFRTFWDPPADIADLTEAIRWLETEGLVPPARASALARVATNDFGSLSPMRTITLKVKMTQQRLIQAKTYLSFFRPAG